MSECEGEGRHERSCDIDIFACDIHVFSIFPCLKMCKGKTFQSRTLFSWPVALLWQLALLASGLIDENLLLNNRARPLFVNLGGEDCKAKEYDSCKPSNKFPIPETVIYR